jgi:hypothetical protein
MMRSALARPLDVVGLLEKIEKIIRPIDGIGPNRVEPYQQ